MRQRSGKTIIALHRAAYLLYQMRLERERLAQRFGHISAQRIRSQRREVADEIRRALAVGRKLPQIRAISANQGPDLAVGRRS